MTKKKRVEVPSVGESLEMRTIRNEIARLVKQNEKANEELQAVDNGIEAKVEDYRFRWELKFASRKELLAGFISTREKAIKGLQARMAKAGK